MSRKDRLANKLAKKITKQVNRGNLGLFAKMVAKMSTEDIDTQIGKIYDYKIKYGDSIALTHLLKVLNEEFTRRVAEA